MKFQRLLIGLLLLSSLSSFAQNGRNNLDLLGQLSYNLELSDVWGYADGNGREYALVGVQDGVSIVDLDTTPIFERHFIPGAFSTWRDLKTYQNYAYVSNESGNGLLVIDLSGLPGTIDFKDTVIAGMQTIHNLWVDEKEGTLYIVGSDQFNGGMAILDLTNDPWRPEIKGNYNNTYVHDVYVRDGLAYSAELNGGLTIVNVNTPVFAYVVGNQGYSGNFTHNTWLNDAGTVCFTTDETSAAYINAWDVSDPTNIQYLDRIRSEYSGGVTIPHNAHVQDDFIVVSYYTDGVIVYDGSRPEALVEVAFYDTSPISGSSFSGAWGAYPFLPSGRLLVSDIEEGLFVLEPTYDRAAFVLGMVTDSLTGMPIEGVEIALITTPETDFSNLDGSYVFGQADSGTYPIRFEKYGYESKTFVVNFVPGQETVLDVELNSLARLPFEVLVKDSKNQLPVEGATVQAFAPANQAIFDFITDLDGRIADPNFIANPYTIRVGKWGFVSQEVPFTLDVGNQTLTVLLDSGYYDDFAFLFFILS
ncbi:MAG: choice-of-anchor B family protein [Bacteroidota bacterium]